MAFSTSFDFLEGVASRSEFSFPLKSPLLFHEMFIDSLDNLPKSSKGGRRSVR